MAAAAAWDGFDARVNGPHGARILLKDDRDSSIGRGCVLYWGHLDGPACKILIAAAQTAPELIDHTMVVSEGWRKIRDTEDRHELLLAFDLSLNSLAGTAGYSDRRTIGEAWAQRIRDRLGPGYQVIVHGEGRNLHIHVEYDP